mgnify:CR=1 FL=1
MTRACAASSPSMPHEARADGRARRSLLRARSAKLAEDGGNRRRQPAARARSRPALSTAASLMRPPQRSFGVAVDDRRSTPRGLAAPRDAAGDLRVDDDGQRREAQRTLNAGRRLRDRQLWDQYAISNAIGSELARHHRPHRLRRATRRRRTVTRIVFDASAIGDSLNVALTMAARLPNEPATSFDRS